ncbi:MAG TPA: malto-oligosyltrehalose trehalohydrolase [Thermoanaerobaculia bacterium]|nr:malto-oligosyltrehalose trehalohydrolase [Thermoanaerobaculia bacterium]
MSAASCDSHPNVFATMIGSLYLGDGRTRFRVWAPDVEQMTLVASSPRSRRMAMEPAGNGYWEAVLEDAPPGMLYRYALDPNRSFPDPASRSQPLGVHGDSEVVDLGFEWTDRGWTGLPLAHYVMYEIHVGTFTPDGTFDAVIGHLDELRELGITAIELMPVAQFPGDRNWGYDGVYPFAAQASYGGIRGLQRLVDACHARGMAAVLDVVYNHLGPEGSYPAAFGPYFTDRYRTPWGDAINFDGPHSDGVRDYFVANALHWIGDVHFDALRLDAVHAIPDQSARPFLQQLAEEVHRTGKELGRAVYLIAESDLNDPRLLRDAGAGGFGLDAQWSDDFHHALHALLTGESSGYYQDFGRLEDLATAWRESFVYSGRYSGHRRRNHGATVADLPPERFVVSSQNHDQIGNRMSGERLSVLVPFEALQLSAGLVLLSPYLPLLFMGEEYGETAPFLYFISHTDQDLVDAVRRGRREEFLAFAWKEDPPDPYARETFERSKLDHSLKGSGSHAHRLAWYRALLKLRREHPALGSPARDAMEVEIVGNEVLRVRRWNRERPGWEVLILANCSEQSIRLECHQGARGWRRLLDSAGAARGGEAESPERLAAGQPLDLVAWQLLVYELGPTE